MWSYHSFVNMASDLNNGLMGPTIVYASGKMNQTMTTHREFVLLYNIFDESKSFLASTNQIKLTNVTATNSSAMPTMLNMDYNGNMSYWKPQLTNMPTVMLSSTQAPMFSTLNGNVFANIPPFEMCQDDKAIWYAYAYGAASHVFSKH
jgi:hypothetical protein